ncbi:hypothetical protein [Mucilaginibacter sp. NFR10]|uniref:hypothetical protein n=1 Tax=Mucilaginibacter sp. NFR10 TaxID=1566292 RepID=UPI0020C873D0|nr:hypothetical protein [Mucilaginibacter sp. NFR10]
MEDYFRWRNEDAHRNALNAHCYWRLRQDGFTMNEATLKIEGMSIANKNELLFQYGVNFNNLPAWQKRGIGLYWKDLKKEGFNPKTDEHVLINRRALYTNMELPMRDEYNKFIHDLVGKY